MKKETTRPEILYRYFGNEEYWLEAIQKKALYAPTKEQLNDPFEMKALPTDRPASRTKFKRISIDFVMSQRHCSRQEAIEYYKRTRASGTLANFISPAKVFESYEQVFKKLGVVSFTESHESLLMWSHYANRHTGICMGFRSKEGDGCFANAEQVKYGSRVPEVRLFAPFGEDGSGSFAACHKSEEWAYEREWRIPVDRTKKSHQKFKEGDLTKVFFGVRMLPKSKEKTLEALGNLGKSCEVYEMKESRQLYGFDIPNRLF